MDDLPPLAIVLATFRRTNEALRTIFTTCEYLGYPRSLVRWYVADDGSPPEHHQTVLEAIRENGFELLGEHNERFREDASHHCGKGWNKGLGIGYQYSDFVLWLEDDWAMDEPLDMTRYVRLLQDEPQVGLVTFRILSTGATVHTVGWQGEIFLKYLRTTQYAYSGNPLLRHARYTQYYGWFAEDRNPGLIELHQDDLYRLDVHDGPEIWRPAMLNQWGGWKHIGSDKTWS
jgi:hypothetical protein